ncbi:cell division protein ZapC [Aeromonas caviae]|uniref:hypothetical protein n=1 Tax=Aeromonas caviae TaxID=648 RepID=UPI0030153D7B
MCIQPNDNWQWHYDAQDDRLMLDLSDRMIFATEYKGRQLVPCSFTTQPFCVDDAALYYQLMDKAAAGIQIISATLMDEWREVAN